MSLTFVFFRSGDCGTCPNADLPIGKRTFKDDTANSTDLCRPCKVCGGVNQDGSQYELDRCTEISDTVCQDCEPCTEGGVRIGCSGTNPGSCVTIAAGVENILATQAVTVPAVLTEPAAVELAGAYEGVGINIAAGTVLTLPESRRSGGIEISASAIEPSPLMMVSANVLGFDISSCVIYFSPSGLQFDPSYTMTLLMSDNAIDQLVTQQFRLAVVRWNVQDSTWEEIPSAELVGSLVKVQNSRFSVYTAVTIPIERTISAAPISAPPATDGGPTPSGPINRPDVPDETPKTTSTIILLSVLGAIIALVMTAVGCWFIRRPKNLQGLPSYLSPLGLRADAQASGQAAIESKISGAPEVQTGPAMVSMPAPFSQAQQTQPSLEQLGGLTAPMSSASMSMTDVQLDGRGLVSRVSADRAGAGAFILREDDLKQAKAVSQRQHAAMSPHPVATTRTALPFGISPASTPGVPPLSLPLPGFAVAQQLRPQSARMTAPSASGVSSPQASVHSVAASSRFMGLDPDAQSQRSARSGRHSESRNDTALDDLDYDSTDNESSWGENESSDGESEGPALTQADLTALLAGVAAAENLSSVYIEPDVSNVFAGFDQYSAGETPYTPASGATSPSGRSRVSHARSNQGVPVSTAAAVEVN